nr:MULTISPECIES: hypothetical protein [Corynebacterium]
MTKDSQDSHISRNQQLSQQAGATPYVEKGSFTDQAHPLRRALRFGGIALLVVAIASLAGWWYVAGEPGFYGALIGAAIGGGFILITVALSLSTAHSSPTTTAAVVLGGWLVKLIALIVILAFIKDLTFYSHSALFLTVVLALIVVLAAESWGILSSRTTTVS